MSSKFLSVEFKGNIRELNNFFQSKGWTFETKNVSDNKILIKVPTDLVEEVMFSQDMPFDDRNEDHKITSFKFIDESEFDGFVLIDNKKEEIKNDREVIRQAPVERVHQDKPTPREQERFSQPKSPVEQPAQVSNSNNIAAAFSDAILPSKSPLPRDDPFVFLSGSSYLRNFIAASTVLLFVITLFD
jgi:hypothetical protein